MSAPTHLLFAGHERLKAGDLLTVAIACKAHGASADVLAFEMASGRQIDLDVRGSEAAIARRYSKDNSAVDDSTSHQPEHDRSPGGDGPRGRGRPKLGVIGREVTLLPRHWAWLDDQRGGASAALRRLVDSARRDLSSADLIRNSQDRTNRFLSAIAGNLPGFEEATRALFNRDESRFNAEIRNWPRDVRRYALDFAKDALRGEMAA